MDEARRSGDTCGRPGRGVAAVALLRRYFRFVGCELVPPSDENGMRSDGGSQFVERSR
ncbi:hypothetical protein HH310_16975 [Actinoplanes sp. TBRC 11911]|uniref:hypothetical protein n=1 Tax=Actinoplanes sp. TBRC 11911 TaxID=2729386 RepID=UPI00145D1606|nr:hypothetical protein [Actinoplanes sp. TBRC 11911]NMO52878.1 hypothetical protein [Actinoplanes sp. TBRC 11911]